MISRKNRKMTKHVTKTQHKPATQPYLCSHCIDLGFRALLLRAKLDKVSLKHSRSSKSHGDHHGDDLLQDGHTQVNSIASVDLESRNVGVVAKCRVDHTDQNEGNRNGDSEEQLLLKHSQVGVSLKPKPNSHENENHKDREENAHRAHCETVLVVSITGFADTRDTENQTDDGDQSNEI